MAAASRETEPELPCQASSQHQTRCERNVRILTSETGKEVSRRRLGKKFRGKSEGGTRKDVISSGFSAVASEQVVSGLLQPS